MMVAGLFLAATWVVTGSRYENCNGSWGCFLRQLVWLLGAGMEIVMVAGFSV